MFATITLVNTSFTSHNDHFKIVVKVKILELGAQSNFQDTI